MTAARPAFARFLRVLVLAVVLLVPSLALRAAPVVGTPSTTFTAAESGRAFMTVGGVWNGTAEVTSTTGDTLSVTFTNTGDATAFDFAPRIVLPANFVRVGTLAVSATSGSPAVSGSPATTGTIDVNLGGYDLPAGASITLAYGLRATTAVASGTYQITYNRNYALADAGALVGYGSDAQQNILVQAGDSIINVTPKQQTKAVGETATFTITVTNTGLGGIFDVTIDESAIYPNGSNLAFVSLVKTAPARAATASNGGSILTLPYLAPGESFVAEAQAVVLSCGSIVNNVASVHRANAVPVTDTVPVQLNLLQPLVDFTPPAATLDYNNPVTVTIPIQNTGLGSAYNFRLQSTLNGGGRTIALTSAAITAGWSYNASNGLFTYGGGSPAGVIPNGATVNLSFTVEVTNPCASSGTGGITYTALYQNGCSDDYSIPIRTQTLSAPANAPSIALAQTVSAGRIAVNETGSYTLTLSATNLANINPAGVTVTDTLPAQVAYTGHLASVGTVNVVGQVVTWTLATADLSADRTLRIDFQVVNEPCNAGQQPSNTATTSNVTTTRGCVLNASANSSFFISNNPGLQASQFFNHTGSAPYETGNADAAPLGTRGSAEGEFIPLEAGYQFGAAYPGTWAGSTYTDGFGGVTGMALASGSLTVTGSFGTVAVPSGSITTNPVGFTIDLGFLAGPTFFNNANVANRSFTLNYRVTAPDSALGSGSALSVLHRVDLFLANGGAGAGICAQSAQNRFTQGAFYSLQRAQAQVGLSLPSVLEVCKDELLTLTVSNANEQQARNVLVTLLNSGTHYTYDTTYTPVYGGVFNSGNITYTANAGTNPTFQFTGGALTGNGTIQVRVRRVANGNTTPGALTARVNYDSWQTAPAVGRVYNSTGSYTPSSVRKANLALTVSPGTISVTGSTISYITYVSNTDAGAAYGATLVNTLPVGFTVNAALTNAANSSYSVSTSAGPGGRQTLTWALGTLASGATVPITLVADVGVIPGCSITLDTGIDRIQAYWGCDSQAYATVTRASPNFVFPAGKMQIVHDSTQTVARLCSPGKVVITVKNTGPTAIQGVIVRDIIPPDQGLTISGTVQYRLNGGALQNVAATHTGTGASGNPYTWTSTQIPALAQLVPVGVSGTNQVTIEITLASNETLAAYSPILIASGEAVISCGSAVLSPAQPFTIPVERPDVAIAKTGRNLTAGDTAYTETVYGGVGDVIEWRYVITNTGNATAANLRFSEPLSGSGGSAVFSSTAGIGGGGSAYSAGAVLSLPDLAASSSLTRYVRETLGGTCVTASPSADISWGCTNNGAAVRSNVTTPGAPLDPATLVMTPSVIGGTTLTQSITSLSGGRASVTVSITNNGGTLYAPVLTATIPSYAAHDTTGPVTLGGVASDITTVTRTGGTDSAPVFTFTGGASPHLLRYGETITVTYYLRPTTFDTTSATSFPDLAGVETNPGLDPTVTNGGTLSAALAFTNSCGAAFNSSNNVTLTLLRPDLDITAASPGNIVLTDTSAANYTFIIQNVGPAGSVADRITLDLPNLGAGWTINSITLTTPGAGGTGGAATQVSGVWTFSPAQVGTLASGSSALVTINAAYSGTPGPLTLKLRARGESRGQDGATITGDYSLDQRAQRIIGVTTTKTLVSTSETGTTGANVLVGEEATFRITATIFGAEGDVTGLILRDVPSIQTSSPTALAYVSHTLTGANQITPDAVTVGGAAPAPVAVPANSSASRIDFTRATLDAATINSGAATFQADVVVRVLNNAATATDGAALTNHFGVTFTYLGSTFYAPDTALGFSGAISNTGLQKTSPLTLRRPAPVVAKTVRNVTRSGSFAANAPGQAGDVVEYRVVITNPGAAERPLYDLVVTDTLPAKVNLSAANVGADTDGALATIEIANTSGASGAGATLTFNQTNTPLPTAGANFTRLDPGQTITLLFRGTLESSVNPTEVLSNTANLRGYTLPLPSGNQTAPQGTENTATGPARLDASNAAAATVTVDNIVQTKTVAATSDPASTGNNVLVGEQIRYRLTVELPQGTIPDLVVRDSLPSGLALVSTPTVTLGSAISSTAQPTITPASLPTNANPLQIQWAFGGRTVASDSVANRTITIEYIAQVRNVTGSAPNNNVAGTTLVNGASFSFNGTGGTFTTIPSVTVTVQAPAVALARGVRNITRNPAGSFVTSVASGATDSPDAGDVMEYRIVLTNPTATNRSAGFDLAIVDTLPAGLAYVPGSATVTTATGITGPSGALATGALAPDVSGQILTWGRTQAAPVNLDIAPGGNLTLLYRAVVADTARPVQTFTNAIVVNWTSLDGDPAVNPTLGVALLAPGNALGERIGTGTAPNTYRATNNVAIITRNTTTATKAKSGDSLPRTSADALDASPSGFRVGELVTYTVTLPVQEGTLAAFSLRDTLPTGLAFHDTVSITPAPHGGTPSETQPMAYTTPVAGSTAPAAGATGALVWSFGDLVNSGVLDQPAANNTANNTLVLVYRARVVATAAPTGIAVTPTDQTLNNTATARHTLGDSGSTVHNTTASVAGITARQPQLTLAKDILSPALDALGNHVRRPGDTAAYRITITNTGTAPAYNVRLTDTLPAGLRATAPVLTAATRNGADVLATQTAPTWDNSTGAYVWNLADGELLLPGQTLVLSYTATVDNDTALRGQTLINSATINQFFSLPSAHPEAASRRQYSPVGPATRSLVVGLRIDGSVYHDTAPNNAKDLGEDWSGAAKPVVYANLVTTGGSPVVFRTVQIDPGAGTFAFDYLPPGDYSIIVTNSAAGLAAQRPANWLFQSPTTGSIAATINNTTGDLAAQDLGLNQGIYAAPAIAKAKSGDTLPRTSADALGSSPSGFRIGDLVTYTLTINPQEGALTNFAVTDVLPAGLAFDNSTPFTVSPASGGRYTYTAPVAGTTAPTTGSSGTVTFTFGAFTNAISGPVTNSDPAAVAAANTLTITYRLRVRDNATSTTPAITPIAVPAVAPASTTTAGLTNSATLAYTKPAPDAGAKAAGPATATIQVEQPRLAIAKNRTSPTPSNLVVPGGTANFQVTVTNDGTAPAYNTVITDTFPVGMRGTAPASFAATLNGAAVTLIPAWTAGTGAYVVTLSSTQPILPGQSLVFNYTATVDSAATRGATLTNTAAITSYASRRSADTIQRRTYSPGLTATADVVVGLRVSGFVYSDLQPDNTRDGAEDWTGGGEPTVFVNLIQSGAVVSSATVAPGTGAYQFTNLPAGTYDLIVTDSPTSTVATRPTNWPFQNPATGAYNFTLTNADLARDFGLHQGTLAAAQIAKTKSGDTLPVAAPASGFRVGDLVTYTVDIQPREGAFTGFIVTDTLPAGLAFHDTVSIAQVSGAPRFTYATPSGANAPAPAATGAIVWNFGNFDNALDGPADNTLRIVYRARVLDTGGVAVPAASPAAATVARANSVRLDYVDASLAPGSAGPAATSIDIAQPRVVLAKTRVLPAADNIVMPGATATFRLTATNNGTAPAYNLAVLDTLPAGLRATAPVLVAATRNGVDVLAAQTAPAWNSATGAYAWSLADAELLLPGQTLVLDYRVTVDADATGGSVLTNSAQVTAYASQASADTAERRVYPATALSSQNLIVGLRVAGSVYHQLIPNGVKDVGAEDWTTGTPVVVNLVANSAINYGGFTLAADQVLRSVAVPVGAGDFAFTNVPSGDYRIVITDTAVNASPAAPATWTFDTPATGSLTPVTVTNADLADQHLGLWQGRVISGRVYNDAFPFGTRETETWAAGTPVVVNLVDAYAPVPVVVATAAVPAGAGAYSFTNVRPGDYRIVVAPAGQTTATTAAVPSGWVFVNPDDGELGAFTLATTDITGRDFGLTPGRAISGHVFNDTNPNGSKDGFEDWTTGTPVVVNLLRASDNTILATVNVAIGAGAYSFANLPPGDYRVIVTNAAGSNVATAPASWLFRNPASGSLAVTIAGADVADRDFALFRGRTVAGRVFRDNGAGSTPANNGLQGGAEAGLSGVTVRLLSAGGSVLDTTQTNGAGDFLLRIPAATANGATLIVEETNPPVHRSTGGAAGDSGGGYNLATDRVTFVYADADVAGLRFGDVPASSLLTDGAQTILPGATATYRHTFRAGTAGTVTFTVAPTATPSLPWSQILVRDLNCNGAVDAGEPIVHGVALAVAAEEEICLLVRDNSPPNAPFGARQSTVVTAYLDYANSALDETMTREDVTTIGTTTAAGLTLLKAVDKATASPGEVLTYTITYTNAGAEVLTELFIDDRTPAYTRFASAAYGVTPGGLTNGVITAPAVNATGTLRWTFGGALAPGASGTVTFQVQVTP